jgi:hypothetical protein
MSLQFRVLGSIAILLLLSLLCGGTLLSLHARSVVEVEVRTAFQGAENSVRDTLQSDVQHTVTKWWPALKASAMSAPPWSTKKAR